MDKEKQWSNALGKPWYHKEGNDCICDMEGNALTTSDILDALNEATEKAVTNANEIKRLNQEKKVLIRRLEKHGDPAVKTAMDLAAKLSTTTPPANSGN